MSKVILDEQKVNILKMLYRVHYDDLNQEDIPISLRLIANTIGIDETRAKDFLYDLEKEDKVQKIHQGRWDFYRITSKGIKYIEYL